MNGEQVFNLVSSLLFSHTGHWKFNMEPHGKELSEDEKMIVALHKDGVGYKKIAKTLKPCQHGGQDHTAVLTVQVPLRTGLTWSTKEVECTCSASYREDCVCEIDVWVLPALLQRFKGVGGQPVSAQTIRRTLHQIVLHGCHPRSKPLLKMMHKKACLCWRQAD